MNRLYYLDAGADEPDPNQDMGSGTEPSDEGLEKSNELKSEAIAL